VILLDTNVVSEAMKSQPDAAVHTWLNAQASETLLLSCITLAEIEFGIEAVPAGRRKKALRTALEGMLALFAGRVLPFDEAAAHRYGSLAAAAKAAGRGISLADGYIAAIAASRRLAVASRDVSPFRAVGLTVIDPWRASM
jgi:hypothetical protein